MTKKQVQPTLRSLRRCLCAAVALAVSCAVAQVPATMSGRVLDNAGKPEAGAEVSLQRRDSDGLRQTKTDAQGAYFFSGLAAGSYSITAARSGLHTAVIPVAVSQEHSANVDLILKGGPAMEFADGPDFAVAGVTDWTAVGGHGSDATLRTSEKLAEQTLALQGQQAAGGSANPASEADRHRQTAEQDERRGDAVAAEREYAHAVRLDPSEENYLAWGSELLLHRAVWQAAETFRSGAAAYPASARMKTAWGAALFASALYDQAAQQLCEASDLNATDAVTYHVLGQVELAAPEPLACVEQRLERFLTLQPKSAEANYLYAMTLKRRDGKLNRQQVERLLTTSVELDPHHAEAYLQLGVLSFEERKYPEAVGFYKKAIAADANQAEAHYRLGVAYQRMGDAKRAEQELQLHDEIEKARADETEQERRRIKQFVMVPTASKQP